MVEENEFEEIKSLSSPEELYDYFVLAKRLNKIVFTFNRLKASIGVEEDAYNAIFPALKVALTSWKCSSLWKLLDQRASHKEYKNGLACKGIRVLIVGGGPVGLRAAIECRMLGCEVVVLERRTRITRNNVLHLWPFTIEDLKQLGAKKFYGKFCAGAIDHISIRSLQTILLKVCLIIGVEIHMGVSYKDVREPQNSSEGWGVFMDPDDHPVSRLTFNVIIGSEGTKYCLKGFDRKEFRGKLALAITANFVNRNTEEEAAVEEISGVAFIFNQKFFKDLKAETDIDLENIVYYKDDTHYFVMTAKKDSLRRKGVLLQDYPTSHQLLAPDNINYPQLQEYALQAAQFSTDLPHLEFAPGNRGQPDTALFDFTSLHAAEHSSRIIRRHGKVLLLQLAGDSLLEPFWPTGTGLARGFLGAQDAAWMIKGMGEKKLPLELLSERESIYQLLSQTTPDRLNRSLKAYTIDPCSRYLQLKTSRTFSLDQVSHLFDDSKPQRQNSLKRGKSIDMSSEDTEPAKKIKQGGEDPLEELNEEDELTDSEPEDNAMNSSSLAEGSITRALYGDEQGLIKDPKELLSWLRREVEGYGIKVDNLSESWSNGMGLAALIYRYHPELIDYPSLQPQDAVKNNQLCFSVAETHLGISSLLKPNEMKHPDHLALLTYLSYFFDLFHDKEPATAAQPMSPRCNTLSLLATSPPSRSWNTKMTLTRVQTQVSLQAPVPLPATQRSKAMSPARLSTFLDDGGGKASGSSDNCHFCHKKVYLMERQSAEGIFFHRSCFKCNHCQTQLKVGNYSFSRGSDGEKGKFFCTPHFRQLFMSNPEAINYGRQKGGPQQKTEKQKSPPPAKVDNLPPEPVRVQVNKGRGGIMDRIKNWETGKVNPKESLPRFNAEPLPKLDPVKEDHKPQPPTSPERRIVLSINYDDDEDEMPAREDNESPEKEISSNSHTTDQQNIGKPSLTRRIVVQDSSEDDEIMPTMTLPRKPESPVTEEKMAENEPTHRRSSGVISRERRTLDKNKKIQSSFELGNRSKARKRAAPSRMLSLGAPGQGQRSIYRKMNSYNENEDLCETKMQEHHKHYSRLLQAQEAQREMSQLEQQYEELEEVGKQIEQQVRELNSSRVDITSSQPMRQFLGLINERNALIRRNKELSIVIKELSLEDKQYEIDARLAEYSDVQDEQMSNAQKKDYTKLLEKKMEIIEERDKLVLEVEEDRIREQEEDFFQSTMMDEKFGVDDKPYDLRRSPTPPPPPPMNSGRAVLKVKKNSNSKKSSNK